MTLRATSLNDEFVLRICLGMLLNHGKTRLQDAPYKRRWYPFFGLKYWCTNIPLFTAYMPPFIFGTKAGCRPKTHVQKPRVHTHLNARLCFHTGHKQLLRFERQHCLWGHSYQKNIAKCILECCVLKRWKSFFDGRVNSTHACVGLKSLNRTSNYPGVWITGSSRITRI